MSGACLFPFHGDSTYVLIMFSDFLYVRFSLIFALATGVFIGAYPEAAG
jgi:hypothetical protein